MGIKPRPKKISAILVPGAVPTILVTWETEEARDFALSLDEFGDILNSVYRNSIFLIVSITFDWEEVLKYINSYEEE